MSGSTRLVAGLAAAASLVVAAGCGGSNPQSTPPSATPTVLSQVSLWVYGPPPVISAYTQIARTFTHEHPETVVNVSPFDSAAAAQRALDKAIAADEAPDVFLAPVEKVPALVEAGSVQRVDDLLGERKVDFGDGFQRTALEAFSAENALQCMPVDVSPLVVYYNTRLLDLSRLTAPGEPVIDAAEGWTLDQFAAAAELVSTPNARGIYIAPTLDQIAPFIFSGGGSLVDNTAKPTTLRLSDGSSESALESLLEVVRAPQLTFSEQKLAEKGPLDRFKNGSLAMILGYRSLTPQLRSSGVDFSVMPLPTLGSSATIGQSSGLCMSAATEHVDQAADFIAYVSAKDASSVLAETGYVVPANFDAVHSDAFLQPGKQPADAAVFSSNVRYIRPLPTVPAWSKVAADASTALTGIFYDPVVDQLPNRLALIDEASAVTLAPAPTSTPSP